MLESADDRRKSRQSFPKAHLVSKKTAKWARHGVYCFHSCYSMAVTKFFALIIFLAGNCSLAE